MYVNPNMFMYLYIFQNKLYLKLYVIYSQFVFKKYL